MTARRRHPAEVTIYRLLYTLERFGDQLTDLERDKISHIIFALEEIQDGHRDGWGGL